MDIAAHYLEEAYRQMRGHKRLAEGAMAQLTDEQLFHIIDAESNSVALIVKHIAGNMRSRFTDFLTTDGEKPDRHRDQEFMLEGKTTREDVMRWWEEGWAIVFETLKSLKPEDLSRTVTVRNEPHSVLQAINRQIAHYSYHVGQIVFLAKYFRSVNWTSLSIPRGKSEEFNSGKLGQNYSKGVPSEPAQK
ncbi:MAG TPA: DinB family protein [Terriglobales bacterium]|nr:DinB family protein [Terriglobales bacterium]